MNLRTPTSGGLLVSSSKLFLPSLFLLLTGCGSRPDPVDPTSPDGIIALSVDAHKAHLLNNAEVTFDFRDRHFSITRNNGMFRYSREYTDTLGRNVVEFMDNEAVGREIEGQVIQIDSLESEKIQVAINSVVYFASLPLPLQDPAVIARRLEDEQVGDSLYHRIEVTFEKEGGGLDYQDRFVYWINSDTKLIDLLAYYFYTDEGGSRFRSVINRRVSPEGIVINEYDNFATVGGDLPIDEIQNYAQLWKDGRLRHVSQILVNDLEINVLD